MRLACSSIAICLRGRSLLSRYLLGGHAFCVSLAPQSLFVRRPHVVRTPQLLFVLRPRAPQSLFVRRPRVLRLARSSVTICLAAAHSSVVICSAAARSAAARSSVDIFLAAARSTADMRAAAARAAAAMLHLANCKVLHVKRSVAKFKVPEWGI